MPARRAPSSRSSDATFGHSTAIGSAPVSRHPLLRLLGLVAVCLVMLACPKAPPESAETEDAAPSASAPELHSDAPGSASVKSKDAGKLVAPEPAVGASKPATIVSLSRRAMRQRWVLPTVGGQAPSGELLSLDEGTFLVATASALHVVAAEDGRTLSSRSVRGRIVDGPRLEGGQVWTVQSLAADAKSGARPSSLVTAYASDKPTAGPTAELLLAGEMRRLVGLTPTAAVMVGKSATSRRGRSNYELLAYKRRPGATRPTPPVWRKSPKVSSGWQWLVRMHGSRLILPDAKRVVALDVSSGVVRWMWRTSGAPRAGVFGVLNDDHYELFDNQRLVRLNASNGKPAAALPLAQSPTSDFAAGGRLRYFGTKEGTVAMSVEDGTVRWRSTVPSAGVPLVGKDWVWTFSGDTVTALNREDGRTACRWDGYRGTKPTLVGDALVFIESPSRRLVAIGCDPAPVVIPAGPCAHLKRCCDAFGAQDPRVGRACHSALSRIVDLRLYGQCRKALLTYAKSGEAPALCRTPPPTTTR